jgi:anti-sigma factor RsiW
MKTIDEEIWAYIDGSCNASESQRIAEKIATDDNYAIAFQELSKLNVMMASDELEEPSMSFSRNVMDAVAQEIAPKKLTTRVNNTIIYGIAAFFILSLSAIFIYILANSSSSSSASGFKMPTANFSFDLSHVLSPLSMKIFLMVDLALALVYMDRLLRRKMHALK